MKPAGSWPLAATLMVALGLLLLVGFVAAGAGVSSLVQRGLVHRALSGASATAAAARSDLIREERIHHTRPLSEDLADLAISGTYILVLNPNGVFQLSAGPIPPVMPRAGFLGGPAQGWFTTPRAAYAYARTSLPAASGGSSLWLVVVQSHARLLGFMAALNRTLWIVGGTLLLLLFLALVAVVREVTGPLADLRRVAERVSVSPMRGDRMAPRASVQEVDALTRAFNRMLDRLDEVQERERRFASDAAHALRTPIQVIRGYSGTLGRWGRLNPAARAEALAAISQTAAGLERLIQRLLELARLEIHPGVACQRLELSSWMEQLRPTWEDVVAHHPLEVTCPPGLWAWTDQDLLGAGLAILLENADAYATADTAVCVEARSTSAGPIVVVVNQGSPLPGSVRDHLFDRFYRGQPSDANHYGLGLALADRMVTAMAAQWVIACPAGRVEFGILLPAVPPDPTPPLREG